MNKWWIYQRERFPVIQYAILVTVISYSLLRYAGNWPGTFSFSAIAIIYFGFYFQLRILDEIKDFSDDLSHRPYRPVPRGLVTLNELKSIGFGISALQTALTLVLKIQLIPFLVVVWIFMLAMGSEFFVSSWLKKHPIVYLASHQSIVPLMQVFVGLWGEISSAKIPFLILISICSGLQMELGRKIRIPAEEENGVETYSTMWGWERALWIWLTIAALGAISLCTLGKTWPLLGLVPVLIFAMGSQHQPEKWLSKVSSVSALWVVVIHLGLFL